MHTSLYRLKGWWIQIANAPLQVSGLIQLVDPLLSLPYKLLLECCNSLQAHLVQRDPNRSVGEERGALEVALLPGLDVVEGDLVHRVQATHHHDPPGVCKDLFLPKLCLLSLFYSK